MVYNLLAFITCFVYVFYTLRYVRAYQTMSTYNLQHQTGKVILRLKLYLNEISMKKSEKNKNVKSQSTVKTLKVMHSSDVNI